MRLSFAFLLVCFVLLPACDTSQTAGQKPDSELVGLYARLLLLNEEYKSPSSGMTIAEFHRRSEEILLAHKTNKEDFIGRVQSVSSDQESFRLFYDEVSKSVQELSKKQ